MNIAQYVEQTEKTSESPEKELDVSKTFEHMTVPLVSYQIQFQRLMGELPDREVPRTPCVSDKDSKVPCAGTEISRSTWSIYNLEPLMQKANVLQFTLQFWAVQKWLPHTGQLAQASEQTVRIIENLVLMCSVPELLMNTGNFPQLFAKI